MKLWDFFLVLGFFGLNDFFFFAFRDACAQAIAKPLQTADPAPASKTDKKKKKKKEKADDKNEVSAQH